MVEQDEFSASPGSQGPRRRLVRDLGVGGLVVLAAAGVAQGPAWRESLHTRHWEDRKFFVHNRANVSTLGDCFTRPSPWPGLYRPLTTNCYYLLGRMVWENRIEVYHGVNLAVFTANGVLLVWLCLDFMPAPWGWLAGALFVSRFAHHQVVAHSVEFQSLASVFFSLAALKLFLAGRRSERRLLELLALPVGLLAFLSKETAVVWPVVAALHGWLFDRPSAARRYLPPLLAAAGWMLLLGLAIRPAVTPEPTGFAYDLSPEAAGRYAAFLLVFANALCLGVPPEADMPATVLRLAASLPVRVTFWFLVAAAAAALWLRRPGALPDEGGRAVAFGWGWFLLAAAPFVVLEDRLFMRYSYFPHAGIAVAVAGVAQLLVRRWARLGRRWSAGRAGPKGAAAASGLPLRP